MEKAILGDVLVRSAIERQLLAISEAAIRLDKIDPQIAPGVRGIGNILRHRYDALDVQIITTVVSGRLDELRSACERAAKA